MNVKLIVLLILIFPAYLYSQNVTKVKMYSDGNTSIKINDSSNHLSNAVRRTWLENSALSFSADGKELYFRHPTDNYYQVWSVDTREKISEITYNEAGNTPKGREIIASFPNLFYPADKYLNSTIWLSADLNISFDKRNNFKVSAGQNQPEKTFTLKLRKTIDDNYQDYKQFYKKAELENIKYQLYYHKKSNKLFIIAYGDQHYVGDKKYFLGQYIGAFSFDLKNDLLTVLAESPKPYGGQHANYIDRWYFFNDNLVYTYVNTIDWGGKGECYFKKLDLASVSKTDLQFASNQRIRCESEPVGWRNQFAGTDLQDNLFMVNPADQDITIYYFDKSGQAKGTFAQIINSYNKRNEVHYNKEEAQFVTQFEHNEIKNVLAVSPSGKNFAYLSINNRSTAGNYASIMMYNVDEKDRVYTFNDQTKYQTYIAKSYITNQESDSLALVWQKQTDAAASSKKQKDEAAKLEREIRYNSQLVALKNKVDNAEKELKSYMQQDLDLLYNKKYGDLLIRNRWEGNKTYLMTSKGYGSNEIVTSFYIKEELRFFPTNNGGVSIDLKETLKLPMTKTTEDGDLILRSDAIPDGSYELRNYSGVKYVTSNCGSAIIDLSTSKFKLALDRYNGCSVKGLEIFRECSQFLLFRDDCLNFLMAAEFKLGILDISTEEIALDIKGKNGLLMTIKPVKTNEQIQLESKLKNARTELLNLEKYITTGN